MNLEKQDKVVSILPVTGKWMVAVDENGAWAIPVDLMVVTVYESRATRNAAYTKSLCATFAHVERGNENGSLLTVPDEISGFVCVVDASTEAEALLVSCGEVTEYRERWMEKGKVHP